MHPNGYFPAETARRGDDIILANTPLQPKINRLYRTTKLLKIGDGTPEIRKLIVCGELMWGQGAMPYLPSKRGCRRPKRCG
jgi:hypothetical protein